MVEAVRTAVHAAVRGRVQGVFFRAYVQRRAEELGLVGWVRNMPEGDSVEVYAEGDRSHLERLVGFLRTGPPSARVEKVDTEWSEATGKFHRFSISF